MIQLHQLEQFCTVAECEHMTRAAELLHVAQPTLSLNIVRLEKELGVKLFDRVGRNIVLNEYGQAYLPHVRAALEELQMAQKALDELTGRNMRQIMVTDCILNNVSLLIREYLINNPAANIVHQSCTLEDMRLTLMAGSIDVGIAALAPDHPMIEEFNWYPVKTTRLVALMREDDPLAQQDTVRLVQLKDRQLEGAIRNFDSRDAFEYYCSCAGFKPNMVYTSIKPYLFNDFTRNNGYISLLPEVLWESRNKIQFEKMEKHMALDGIVGKPLVEPECTVIYGVLTRKNVKMSKAVRNFRDYAVDYMERNLGLF